MVILMYLTGQNLNWLKNYDTKCTLRLRVILAKSEIDNQNLHLINGRFTTISDHFCANYMIIFHKTEIQTIISRCWPSLNHDWYYSYDTKCKNRTCIIFYNIAKKWKWKYLHFESWFLNQSRFRPVKHLKMTIWTSVL